MEIYDRRQIFFPVNLRCLHETRKEHKPRNATKVPHCFLGFIKFHMNKEAQCAVSHPLRGQSSLLSSLTGATEHVQ